jgi:hypothetical protein
LHLTPLTRLGNPRNNLLLYLTTYNAFYETQSEQHHFFIFFRIRLQNPEILLF